MLRRIGPHRLSVSSAFDGGWGVVKATGPMGFDVEGTRSIGDEMVSVDVPTPMLPLIEMLMQNPQMWMEMGSDQGGRGTTLSRERPKEQEMFNQWQPEEYESEGWTPESDEGPFHDDLWLDRHDDTQPWGTGGFDYHDHDADSRGSVSQIDLVQALMRLLEDGRTHL